MKPPPFRYTRVDDAAHAVERLAELGDGAKVLAGGQSLLPMMSFRLARPTWLVDVGRVSELRGATVGDGTVAVGALTTHRDVAGLAGCPVLAETAPLIAHEPIRARGTFGGSVAHGDPVAEWCVATTLLDGEIDALGPGGRRTIPAASFFHGMLATDLAPDELLTEVRLRTRDRAAICEHARRHGDFALVVAAVAFDLAPGEACRDPRIVVGGVDAVPLRLPDAEAVIDGVAADDDAIGACAHLAAAAIDPASDVHAGADDRRALTAVLVERALRRALGAA